MMRRAGLVMAMVGIIGVCGCGQLVEDIITGGNGNGNLNDNIGDNANSNLNENQANDNISANDNHSTISVSEAVAEIADDIQRAIGCGDTTLVELTDVQVEQFLEELYNELTPEESYEAFVQQQAEIYQEHADEVCATGGNDNNNANTNSNDNTPDNSNSNDNVSDNSNTNDNQSG
ncbi:MAG: hypothetical protein HJJLKODD_00816 [Phycisphaerae bacterium]|nr:hypothetical protein [Phycisphaerae bacterium]